MKKIACLLFLLVLACALLFSCKVKKNEAVDNTGTNGSVQKGENVIFSANTEVVLVSAAGYESDELSESLTALADAIIGATGRLSLSVNDGYASCEHEIVLGDTNRNISKDAKSRLDKAIKNAEEEPEYDGSKLIGYTVYSDGSSVAIVWSDELLCGDAVNYFIEKFVVGTTLKLDAGYSKTNFFVYTDYLAEKRLEQQNEAWALLEKELSGDERGAEIVSAMKNLYSLYTTDMLYWLANLYDPDTGGWYHSNSARNTEGFLPDIASTWTALTLMSHTGMVESWSKYVPDKMKQAIGSFVVSLQDADGYFYHPQWGKGITNDKREEHLLGAQSILSAFKITPKYPYPGSSSTVSATSLTVRSCGAVYAASSLVQATATLPQYESVSAYRAWLDEWYGRIKDGKTSFYSFGDELQSQVANMKIYGKTLGADLLKITTDFLTAHQLENGLWDSELNYTATNAVHKIASVYNSAECEIPNVDRIIEAGIEMISDENSISACVDIYNAWSCISYLITNVRKYAVGDEAVRNAKADEIIREARLIAPEAIIGAFNKIEPFRKLDGSFSYGPNYSSAGGGTGMMTAVSHTVEGDVLGNSICMTSLVSEIYASLDIETFVPIFTKADYYLFMDIISGLGTVVKDTIVTESEIIDFEDSDDASDVPAELNANLGFGSLSIASLDGNKYLRYVAADGLVSPQNQPSLDINAQKLTSSPGYAVIEMDIQYLEGHGTVGNQLMLYGSSAIIMQLGISTQSGAVVIKNSADSTKVLATAPVNQKFKLRIEYYWNEGFAAIYLNDDKLPSGVTTDLYPDKGIHQTFSYLHFGAARAQAGVTLIDNVKVEVRASKGEAEVPEIKPKESEIHDFEYSSIGDTSVYPLTVNQGSEGTAAVGGGESGKYLELTNVATESGHNPSVRLYSNDLKETVNKATVQMDLKFLSSTGGVMYIYGTNKFINQFNFGSVSVDGTAYITLKNPADSKELLRVPAGEWFTLRIEYFWDAGYFAFYVNGSESPVSYATALSSDSKGHSKFDYVQLGASRGTSGVLLVDNIMAECTYVDEIPEMPKPAAPKNPDVIDFDNVTPATGLSPSDISASLKPWGSGTVDVVKKSEGNNALDPGKSSLWLYTTAKTPDGVTANATVVEFTLNYTDSTVANDGMYWRYAGSGNTTQMDIKSNSIRVGKADGSHSGWIILVNADGTRTADGDDITLRFEYLWSGSLNVYSNGVLIIENLEVKAFDGAFERFGWYAGTNTRTIDEIFVQNVCVE